MNHTEDNGVGPIKSPEQEKREEIANELRDLASELESEELYKLSLSHRLQVLRNKKLCSETAVKQREKLVQMIAAVADVGEQAREEFDQKSAELEEKYGVTWKEKNMDGAWLEIDGEEYSSDWSGEYVVREGEEVESADDSDAAEFMQERMELWESCRTQVMKKARDEGFEIRSFDERYTVLDPRVAGLTDFEVQIPHMITDADEAIVFWTGKQRMGNPSEILPDSSNSCKDNGDV